MTNTIKINGKYGAKVGNIQVFTYERAIEVFKIFVERCYKDWSMEASSVLSDVADDMHRIGFGYDELEDIEIEVLRS